MAKTQEESQTITIPDKKFNKYSIQTVCKRKNNDITNCLQQCILYSGMQRKYSITTLRKKWREHCKMQFQFHFLAWHYHQKGIEFLFMSVVGVILRLRYANRP